MESGVAATPFFSSPVELGVNGVEEIYNVGPLSDYEQEWYDKMLPELQTSIDKGIQFHKDS